MVLLRTDTLRDILASTTRYHSINPPSSAPDALNSIDLSDIPTITFTHSVAHLAESLRENGISTPIYQSTMKHVSEVALAYRGSFDNCCRTLLAKPQAKDDQFVLDTINNFRQTLQVRFENHDFPSMLSKAIDAQKNLDSHSQSPAEHKPLEARERKPFNHVCILCPSLGLHLFICFLSLEFHPILRSVSAAKCVSFLLRSEDAGGEGQHGPRTNHNLGIQIFTRFFFS